MEEAHVRAMIFLVWNDKLARTTVFSVLVLSLILTLSLSFLCGVLVFGSYILGFFFFSAIFSHVSELPNLLFFLNGNHGRLSKKLQSRCCTVCGNSKCSRHQPSFQQPWLGLDIPEQVDEALEKFFKKALDEFIYNWYSEMSSDENFIQELKQSIRYATSVLLRSLLQVDFPRLIMCKLLPAGIQHLDDFLGIQQWAKSSGISIDSASLQYIGTRMHPAAFNREMELAYLRQLTNLLLPHLMPNYHLNCSNYKVLVREVLAGWILLPTMDTVADPSVINSLLLLVLDRQPLTNYPKQPQASVPFLAHFAMPTVCPAHFSALRLDMAGVLKDQSLLYPFMQFLKGEGSVNILQFCLDVEEFNRKMITPDLREKDTENLYREAWDLYSVYFNPDSPDHIPFSASVVEEMHSILQEHPGNIVKLRTTPPLFQAYEFAFSQLENTLGPLFHQSDDYFILLCGQRLSNNYTKSGSRLNKKWNEGGAVAKLSSRLHKIKGALRAQPVEGHTFDNETALDLGETEFAENLHLTESSTCRDLSAWRVSIPSVESQMDINNKPYPVFRISVQRIDVKTEDDPSLCHWSVDRRYNDFYLLESKLTEFHGEFSDLHLPPKRILFGPRSVEFMESKRHVFEDFLQKLLQKPNLRGSDLLHTFLQSPTEFVPASVGVPEGLGRMIRRSVPIRLRKERGQHLDTFLTTYMTSTEMGKTRSSKYEWKDINATKTCKTRLLTQTVFHDNFGILFNQPSFVHMGVGAGGSALRIQGIFDCALYLAVRVFGASKSFLQLGLTLQTMFHNILTIVSCKYLNFKLGQLLVPQRVAHLIKLLQGAVFGPKTKTLSAKELELRAEKTLKELQDLLPGILSPWLGKKYGNGVSTLFSCLQNPLLNKQLSYYLLDIVAVELFPDVVTGELSP